MASIEFPHESNSCITSFWIFLLLVCLQHHVWPHVLVCLEDFSPSICKHFLKRIHSALLSLHLKYVMALFIRHSLVYFLRLHASIKSCGCLCRGFFVYSKYLDYQNHCQIRLQLSKFPHKSNSCITSFLFVYCLYA